MPHKDPAERAAYHKAYEAKRRGTRKAYMAEWWAAHREQEIAKSRARYDPDKNREYHARYNAEHREEKNARQRAYAAQRRAAKDPAFLEMSRAGNTRHKERAADPRVTWTDVQSTECGVCHEPLQPNARWPDPLATTVGHKPPLSRAAAFTEGVRRPEHWICNLKKRDRLDSELVA